ncbi:hypothetical protein EYF80_001166 [Liparis tanakae]|uniref:Uncharacterized protein n=1 Tax=Liparis tanakae TaxID=230148 RepID=A0A4Z2JEY6_9TELE|nr:hypothetical protein EYF80_001166 [Liparis tanakae]
MKPALLSPGPGGIAGIIFCKWNSRAWQSASAKKTKLHKPDLTYLVKRLKCKLTGNVFASITCFSPQSAPPEHSQARLAIVT